MIGTLFRDSLLWVFAVTGVSAPWLGMLGRWRPLERIGLAIGCGLVTAYLIDFGLYAAGASLTWFWIAPAAGWIAIAIRPASVRGLLQEKSAREMAAGFAIVAAWCLGWQCLVVSYSGAAWSGDWVEHYDRAQFFRSHWNLDFKFLEIYPLPSRPPLMNLWIAGLLTGTGGGFAHYQVVMTLSSGLIFVPLAALVERWGGKARSLFRLVVLLMLNPFFVQNMTWPWTKLLASFFAILAFSELLPSESEYRPGRLIAAAMAIAAGMLVHYSTGPWALALGMAWICTRERWGPMRPAPDPAATGIRPGPRSREIAAAAALSIVLVATWLAWSVAHFGAFVTFAENTTLAMAGNNSVMSRMAWIFLNAYYSLTPDVSLAVIHPLLQQSDFASRMRDFFFVGYQLRLSWAFGSVGSLILAWLVYRQPHGRKRRFVAVTAGVLLVAGAAAHAQPSIFGITHVVYQPLVALGLCWLAVRGGAVPRAFKAAWAIGLAIDLVCGIAWHFGIQSLLIGHWLHPGADARTLFSGYTAIASGGFSAKESLRLSFLADVVPRGGSVLLLLASAMAAVIAIFLTSRKSRTDDSPAPG